MAGKGKVVYTGRSHVRTIETDSGREIVFDRSNNWTVDEGDITKDLLDKLKESHSDEFSFGGGEEVDQTLGEKAALAQGAEELSQHQPPSSTA